MRVLPERLVLVAGFADQLERLLLVQDFAAPQKLVLLLALPGLVVLEPHLDLLDMAWVLTLVSIQRCYVTMASFIYLNCEDFVVQFSLID